MKKIILIVSLVLITINFSYSQLPDSYPFKTFLGDDGYLYVTGNVYDSSNQTYDILIEKYLDSVNVWSIPFLSPYGNDKGMDIVVDNNGFVLTTGYLFNSETNTNDIFILKLEKILGSVEYIKKYNSSGEDKGLGIAVDNANNIYVCGYITKENSNKDFIALKYSELGIPIWTHQYDNPRYHADDVSTDILTDAGFVYAVGYTSGGINFKDVMMLTFPQDNSEPPDVLIYQKALTNEIPTGFVLSYVSDNAFAKSRASITCITDIAFGTTTGSDFLTLNFKGTQYEELNWAKTFNSSRAGARNADDVPTAITADDSGNVYVTGYCNRNYGSNYDFATIKYTKNSGNYGWNNNVEYFDYGQSGGSDKASSIKSWQNQVYVSGACAQAPSGYEIQSYVQNPGGGVSNQWHDTFYPSFSESNDINEMKKATTLEVDKITGDVWMIVFAWDENQQYLAFRKYDKNGNIISTVDNNQGDFMKEEQTDNLNSQEQQSSFSLSQNYPNPFNPTTNLEFSISELGFVTLKIYDMTGKEIRTLVNEVKPAGRYSVVFDGSNLSSGIYYYKLESGAFSQVKRMILVK